MILFIFHILYSENRILSRNTAHNKIKFYIIYIISSFQVWILKKFDPGARG